MANLKPNTVDSYIQRAETFLTWLDGRYELSGPRAQIEMNVASIFEPDRPLDLDPATIPIKGHTVTVLRRHGFYNDWSHVNDLTEATILDWRTLIL